MSDIREAAMNCEVKLYADRKNRDGRIVSFVVHPSDMPDGLALADIGTRFIMALVEIGDDEKPKGGGAAVSRNKPTETTPRSDKTPPKPPGGAKSWHEMSPAQQAGILCSDPKFWRFLAERLKVLPESADTAAHAVRLYLGVNSRAEIQATPATVERWNAFVSAYRAWEKLPEVVS